MPESAPEAGRIAGTSAGNETITAPAGHTSVSGEGGGDLLIGSSGDNRIWITDPKDRVQEAANGGIDTEIGWTSIKLAANVENLQVNGAFNYAVGNNLGNLITVDNATHWIYGAGGDDVLVGATTEKTTFVVRAGEGSDVIYNWNGNDQLQLWGYGFTTAAQIRSAMTQTGSDVVLKLNASETLTFRGVTTSAFQDRQFLLPLDQTKVGTLTFSDEFNSLQVWDPSLSTGKWRADFGGNLKDEWAYTITSNGERQVYVTPGFYGQGEAALDINPFSISNGVLTIRAERLAEEDRESAWGREYSSGMLNTMGMFEQKYGYFEMKAELPTAVGSWPAFWMMPTPYVAQTEADIMEGLAATPNVDYRRAWGGSENLYDNAYKIDPAGFHTYGMLWTPQTVTFYYDGVAVLQAPTPANWTQPMALIVNMAVGGWGGEPNSLQFPADMKIDYVKAYALAGGGTVTETGTPEVPAATLHTSGGATSGQVNAPVAFESDGTAVTTAKIAVFAAKPATPPAGKTFVIWEDSGAVFGAVATNGAYDTATPLMAGRSNVFTGTGTWLSDGKVALGYMQPDGAGQAAWVMVFDRVKHSFTKHELGPSTGDIDIVATKNGGFVASWDGTDGQVHGRGYDAFAYDGEGWFGPDRVLSGDVTGITAQGQIIAQSGGGQQLYDVVNPPRGVSAIVSIGPMAGVQHPEGNSGTTPYTFTVTREFDLSEKVTVGWQVTGQGANPTNAADFTGGVLPSGVVTFEINQATATITVPVAGDTLGEQNEQFLVTLVNPVGAKLGQATATGFVDNDDSGGATPPPAAPQIGFTGTTVNAAEGNTGSTAFSFTVVRTGSTTGVSSASWTVSGSGANPASATDFTGGAMPSGTVSFAAGETSKTITVNVAGDAVQEANESFTVTLANPGGASLGTATATGVITNDDSTAPPTGDQVINSPGPGSTVTGGPGNDTINASQGADVLTGGAGADRFAWAAEPWAPARITDFVVGTDRLDLTKLFQAAGYSGADPVADRYVTFLDDPGGVKLLFDRDGPGANPQWGNYILQLEKVSAAGLTWAQLTGGSAPPPPPPSGTAQIALSTPSVTLAEGASGSTAFTFTVTRGGSTTGTSTVGWSLGGSGANPATASDFAGAALPSGTLTFAAGETAKTITVNVAGDTAVEANETFTLTLANPTGATLGAATATGTITNDDSATPPPGGGSGQVINSPGPGSTLTGGSGDDTLNASQGQDVLTGGAGADRFVWAAEPWAPARVTDFLLGTDRLDLSKLFQAAGYSGSDPVADKYVVFLDDGAGGTKLLFDRDGAGSNPQWANYVIQLDKVSSAGLTWAQLANGGGTTPPPSGSAQLGFSSSSASALEGNSGTTAITFTVVRSGPTTGSSSASWSVTGAGSVPASASDFAGGVLPSGTVSFAPGETSKLLVVNVAGDTLVEGNESFSVTLSAPTGATLGAAVSTGVINNDDGGSNPPPSGNGQLINSPGPGSTLTGGSGNDTLVASQGQDELTGGGGADYFAFPKEPWAPGHITDFLPGTDKIDLRALFDSVGFTGADPFAAGYLKLIDDGTGGTKVLFDRDAGGPNPQWPNYILNIDHVAPGQLGLANWLVQ